MHEIWKKIKGFKNYEISNHGRVRRCTPGRTTRMGKIRKPGISRGYYNIALRDNVNKPLKTFLIHRLVACHFIGRKPTKKHVVAHWDNIKTNNRVSNLRWATSKENKADQLRHNTLPRGNTHYKAKLTSRKVSHIRRLRNKGVSWKRLAERFQVCIWTIRRVCNGEAWRHV